MGSVLPQCQCDWKMPTPQHTWVGLTDEELEKYHDLRWWSARELAREVENKLKERNGYSI